MEVSLEQVGAHYAISSMFTSYPEDMVLFCYTVRRLDYENVTSGRARLAIGRCLITSNLTEEAEEISFAALHFGATASHDDFVFLSLGISLHSRTRVRSQLGCGIFDADRRFRLRGRPVRRRQIDRPGVDAHRDAGRLVARHGIFFDGDERVRLDRIRRAITERDAGDAFRAGLNQITFIKRGVKIGLYPLDRVHFFHENFAVEVHEFRLRLAGGDGFAVAVVDRRADFLYGVLIEVGADDVEHTEDDGRGEDNVHGDGLVGDCRPIHLDPMAFRIRRGVGRAAWVDWGLRGHEFLRTGSANFEI